MSLMASVAALLLLALPGVAAQGKEKSLDEVERAIASEKKESERLGEKAKTLSEELKTLRRDMITAARRAQESEEKLTSIETMLDQLNVRAAEKRAELLSRRRQTTLTLAALERLALRPPEALIFQPAPPLDSVRSALLMRTALPPLEARSRSLNADLGTLRELREEIDARQGELLASLEELDGWRGSLKSLIDRKAALHQQTEAERKASEGKMRRLAREAKSLRDLVARLESSAEKPSTEKAERIPLPEEKPLEDDQISPGMAQEPASVEVAALGPAPALSLRPAGEPFSRAKGHVAFPVRGRLVARYGQPTGVGTASKGLTLETREDAQVVAPYDGEVLFAGPFRGYGQLLIISHGEGYHILLSGLSRIDTAVGHHLLAGEPVGVMGKSKKGNPSLYVELRRRGEPINLLPWLVAGEEKVRG